MFFNPAEVQSDKLSFCTLQHCIEEPEIHMIAGCSSSVADQAALIPDRLECIQTIHLPVISSNGIPINDLLQLFIGDHPAQSFERGTKKGGTYKCGSCGCPNSRMEDAAYALTLPCRSLQDLQALVTAGYFGKTPNALRPLENLKVEEIRKELRLRKIYNFDGIKDIQQQLDTILKGARVSTLLILNQTQSLSSPNLGEYTVLDCEPLHDIKGHLLNLFEELPHILPAEIRVQCQELIETNLSRETVTGADIRMNNQRTTSPL